jgi:predicted glycosyltransferase
MPPSSPVRVLIHVQHLLGIGHLQRSFQLAAELDLAGFEVELISGGKPCALAVPGSVKLRQLPPLYSPDGRFTQLLDCNGREIDDQWRNHRKQCTLDIFEAFSPHILITETFPFGRRMLRFELLPLLEAARKSNDCVQTIASIRDILQPKSKPGREQEICELIDEYYDHVLIHGDQRINRLADSFSLATRIEDKVSYSGYICAPASPSANKIDGVDEVLVSAGGSDTGFAILEAAIAARSMSVLSEYRWRVLVSPSIGDSSFQTLQGLAGRGIIVERNRPDFSGLMKRARLSISQAGYNTVTDIINSNLAAVVVPYAEADEIEQTLRAQTLQRHGRLVMLERQDLTATKLAAAVDRACELNTSLDVDLAGAANCARMISQWLNSARTTS